MPPRWARASAARVSSPELIWLSMGSQGREPGGRDGETEIGGVLRKSLPENLGSFDDASSVEFCCKLAV